MPSSRPVGLSLACCSGSSSCAGVVSCVSRQFDTQIYVSFPHGTESRGRVQVGLIECGWLQLVADGADKNASARDSEGRGREESFHLSRPHIAAGWVTRRRDTQV